MAFVMNFRGEPGLPIETIGWLPEITAHDSLDQFKQRVLPIGNRRVPVGDLFDVQLEGSSRDEVWQFTGDLRSVHGLGTEMNRGELRVSGAVGRHCGARMRGGVIEVSGDAGDWAGAEMAGGELQIFGSAGDSVGGAYRGSPIGMTGGRLFVKGSVGAELGRAQRRGLIAVGGDAGDLCGMNMKAGTILIAGQPGRRIGAGMIRGTIVLWNASPFDLLPSFQYACRFRPPMWAQLLHELNQSPVQLPQDAPSAEFKLFSGDRLEGGRGEILHRVLVA